MALRDRQEKSAHDRSSPTPSGLPGTRASAEDSSSAGRQRLPPLSSLLSPHVGKGPETSSKAAESSPTSVPTLKEDKSTWSPERRDPRIANSPSASEARLMDRQKRFRSDSDERSTTGQGSASGIAAGRAYPAASSSAQYGAPSERWGDRPQAFPSSQQRIYGEPFNARPAGQELPPLNSLNILSPNSNVRTSPRGAPTYAQQRRSPLLSQEADRERQARAFLAPARHHSLSVSSHPEATSPEARQASASISSQGSSISRGPFARSSAAPAFSATREPARRRWSDNLSRDRGDSTSSRDDIFARIWDLFAYAKQQNDEFEMAQASGSSLTIPPMPAIDRGDVASVSAYLRRELELLHRRDPQLAIHIADDEAALLEQQRMAQLSPDSAESYEESRFGPHRTSRQGVYASGRGMGQLDHRRPPPFGRAASHYDQGSHLPPYAHRGGVASSPYGYPGQDVPSFRHRSSDPSERYRADFRFYDRGQPRYSHHDEEMLSHSQHNMQAGINSMPRRVRKRRDEAEQSCLSCSATETPEWRKGPTGPRTLCNACGLLFAKQCRKREFDAQARGERPKGGRALAPEDMTPEEKERSLVELQLAVHARTGQAPMAPAGMAVPSMTGLPGHR